MDRECWTELRGRATQMYLPRKFLGAVVGLSSVVAVVACSSPAAQTPPLATQPPATPTASSSSSATQPGSSATPSEKPAGATATELVTLNVENFNSAANVGMYIANERGYFREQGIAINWVPFTNGADEIPALATGQLDIGGP